MLSRKHSDVGLRVALFLLTALFVLRGILPAGIPSIRHDWIWPVMPVSAGDILATDIYAWTPLDLGAPTVYPSVLPLLVVEAILVTLFGSKGGLLVLLLGLYIAAGEGTYRLLRSMGAKRLSAVFGGVAYMYAPPFFDQLVAGHLGDLAVLAGFPWLIFSVGLSRNAAIVLGSVAASIMSIQLQGLAMTAISIVAAAALLRRPSLLYVPVIAVLSQAPSVVGLLWPGAGDIEFIKQSHAVLEWEIAQSSSFLDALAARGYAPGYDGAGEFTGLARLAALSVVVLPVVARRRREGRLVLLCILYAIGVVVASGLKGPAASLFATAFPSFSAASLFRELFHIAPFVALPIAVGGGMALDLILVQKTRASAVVGVGVVVAFAFWSRPSVVSTFQLLPLREPTALETAFIRSVSANADETRFVIYPGRQPYRSAGSIGVDALSYYMVRGHMPIFAYFPEGPIALASDLWLSGRRDEAMKIYRLMSVRGVLDRALPTPAAQSIVDPRERLRAQSFPADGNRISNLHAFPIVRGGKLPDLIDGDFEELTANNLDNAVFMQLQDDIVGAGLYRSIHGVGLDRLIAERCYDVVSPEPSSIVSSPSEGWVSGWRYGPFDRRLDYALRPVVVTTASDAGTPFRTPVDFALVLSPAAFRYRWIDARALSAMKARPIAIAAGAVRRVSKGGCRDLARPMRSGEVTVTQTTRRSPDVVEGFLQSDGKPGSVIFSDAFSEGWKLTIDGRALVEERHYRANGFANGWVVERAAGRHRFALTFAPSNRFHLLLLVACATYLSILLLAFRQLRASLDSAIP